MGTISAFFQFVLDDPIMMGLCLAIIVLVALFIFVLILGKKADTQEKKEAKEEKLLKTEINLDVSNSTESVIEPQNVSFTSEPTRMEPNVQPVPVTFEEATKVEVFEDPSREKSTGVATNLPNEPVIHPTFDSLRINSTGLQNRQVEQPTIKEADPINSVRIIESSINEAYNSQNNLNFSNNAEVYSSGIVESRVNPVGDNYKNDTVLNSNIDNENYSKQVSPVQKDPLLDGIQSIKSFNTEPINKIDVSSDALRDMYSIDDDDVIDVNIDDVSKTEVISHIPMPETNEVKRIETEDLDDIDLPKFNTNNEANELLNSIKGETFNINN